MSEKKLFGAGFLAPLQSSKTSVRLSRPGYPDHLFGDLVSVAIVPLDSGDAPHIIRLEFARQAIHVGDNWNPARDNQWRLPTPQEYVREIILQNGAEMECDITHLGAIWKIRDRFGWTFTFYPMHSAIDFEKLAPAPTPRKAPVWRAGPQSSDL